MPVLQLQVLQDAEFRYNGWPGSALRPSWYLDRVRAFLCQEFPIALEYHVQKAKPKLTCAMVRLIHQVFEVALEQRCDLESRLQKA